MAESLEDRIRDHAAAFNGLLSLIPSKLYYGADATADAATTTDESALDPHNNKKKKKTKAEKKAAKKARLDPDNDANRSAKDVMDEAGRKKRKLQELEEEAAQAEEYEEVEGIEPEKPREGLKEIKERTKKAKIEASSTPATQVDATDDAIAKPAVIDESKAQKKTEKLERKKQKAEQKKTIKTSTATAAPSNKPKAEPKKANAAVSNTAQAKKDNADEWTDDETSAPQSPTFDKDASKNSATTEDSSTGSPASPFINTESEPSDKPRLIKVPKDTAEFRERFAAKMAALRAARFKDNGIEGKPVRTRHELIESRREKQIARKAHKKEQRQAAKHAEELKREKALASNSPQLLSPPGMELELNETTANLSFGRVAFGDGSQLSHDLSYSLSRDAKKGPSDPKTALLKLQNAKKRLAAMTPEKRAEIEDKEAWLTARRRAEGEKIRDDESSLKKAVKRKDRVKKRSEREWNDRLKGVEKAKADKQKKRETNLRKRVDDKLERKLERASGKKRSKSGSGGAKKKSRPGFEGSGFGKKK
ncbi:hypothetical protein BROUX41_000381 [Berkeleyomyces rouxiae]|uniref:uncharacterized protein n=1 Tax=Berkeleyomyces rouxiae TaxID=2035830 RepID=UPI003B8169B3